MFPNLTRPARRTALLIAILFAAGLAVQLAHLDAIRAEPLAATLWDAARSFSGLTQALVAISLAIVSRPLRGGVSEPWLAALTLAMILAAAAHHLAPGDAVPLAGMGLWADHALHSLAPVLLAIWWLVHAPKRRLDFVDLPMFALWPSVYGAYAFARGAADGLYPNSYLDPVANGSGTVALTAAGILLVFLLGGVMMISIGHYANR
jgi:hypothetical protein